jgi:predicted RNA-binding protein
MLHKARQAAKLIAITALLSLPMVATAQQDEGDGAALRAQFAGMQRTGGEIVAIAGNKLTVKTAEGDTAQIVTTDNTRIIKGRGITVKLADLKVGDGVMAAGNLDAPNKTLHAAILFATDAAEVKKLRDNLGKTYIAGKVTAIDLDNAKMTVERPDKVSQTIGFDETTSFKRGGRGGAGGFGGGAGGFGGGAGGFGGGAAAAPPADAGESITLADIKVGDNVHGIGSVKGGTFVPTQLNVATPGQHRRSNGAAPQP